MPGYSAAEEEGLGMSRDGCGREAWMGWSPLLTGSQHKALCTTLRFSMYMGRHRRPVWSLRCVCFPLWLWWELTPACSCADLSGGPAQSSESAL